MACTGGWDWAPYSYTGTSSSNASTGFAQTLSKGLWKSVYLVEVPLENVVITHLTPHTHYKGEYPTTTLQDGKHGGFRVNVTAHFWAPPGGAKGLLAVKGSWADNETRSPEIAVPAGESQISMQLSASATQIKLWWPTGVGAQPLYNVTATWTPSTVGSIASGQVAAARQLGFRAFALVTINDTDSATIAANATSDGTGTHGMFFRVNGAALYSRGGKRQLYHAQH
jgi:beta-mannosidase